MKRIIRLTEGDLRRIVKRSANRILREYMFDNPLNKTDIDGSEFEDEEGLTPEVGTAEYDPDIDDLGMNGPDDNIEGFKSPFYGLRGYNDDDEEFLRNAEYDANEYDDDYGYDDEPMELPESRRRMSRIIKESIRKVLREASVYPGYDSTTTADIAGNGGGNIGGGNIITCYGNPNAIKSGGASTILGPGVIYLGCNPNYSQMYGNVVPVKVDVSNFYRAKNSSEAIKLAGSPGFKDEYSGILYHSNMDGDVCAVFDRSCIIG